MENKKGAVFVASEINFLQCNVQACITCALHVLASLQNYTANTRLYLVQLQSVYAELVTL